MTTTATPILRLLALEHVRAVADACSDHIWAIAEARTSLGNRATLSRMEDATVGMTRVLGAPHLPDGCPDLLRTVGTEAVMTALGVAWRSNETSDALAQRVWTEASDDLSSCVPTVLEGDHQEILGRVRSTLLAWRRTFTRTNRMTEGEAGRAIDGLSRALLTLGAVCLLAAASNVTES